MLFRRPALWRLRAAWRGKNDSLRLLTGTLKLSAFCCADASPAVPGLQQLNFLRRLSSAAHS
ncbi:hypothetical protein PCAR4_290122 [Paraburkholderia caribensis]|nr:hypothetical protein PCAR4_290122 [Paraburkholderia caribensis]